MKRDSYKYTYWASIIVAVVFLFKYTYQVQHEVTNKNCIAAYDQFGYYSYLPAVFIYDDIGYEGNWMNQLQDDYCWGSQVYQFKKQSSGKSVNIYHAGLAYLHLPAFLVADFWAQHSGFKRDGMSLPYRLGVQLTACFFVLLGLFYLRKIVLMFFDELIAAIVIVLIYAATNVFVMFNWGELMPHLYLFTLNTMFLYFLLKYKNYDRFKDILFSAVFLGIGYVIRPTEALWGIFPIIILYQKDLKKYLLSLSVYLVVTLVLMVPQLLYWKAMGGDWLILNLHSESLILYRPHLINFLFSFRKGWLLYSPIFIFALIGLYYLYKSNQKLGLAVVIFSVTQIYVLSCWETWWYAAGFGSRVMIDSYVVFAISLGVFIQHISKNKKGSIVVFLLIVFFISLSIVQSVQYAWGIIPPDRMTKDHYFHVFGQLDKELSQDQSLLLIDRSNPDWDAQLKNPNKLSHKYGYQAITKQWLHLDTTMKALPENEFFWSQKVPVYELSPTDEAKLKIDIKYHTHNAKDAIFALAITGYNDYFFHYIDLDKDTSFVTSEFNLPEIRHRSDILKCYVWNPDGAEITIRKIEAEVTYLKR